MIGGDRCLVWKIGDRIWGGETRSLFDCLWSGDHDVVRVGSFFRRDALSAGIWILEKLELMRSL